MGVGSVRARGAEVGRVAGTVLALVVAFGLAGCSDPPTVGDGSLGVDWAVLPTPSVPAPAVGACTAADGGGVQTVGWTLAFLPGTTVACTEPHLAETYHVAVFPPDVDTDPLTVPAVGGARFRYAYGVCLEQATGFLGDDPHTSRLVALPVMPTDRQWAGRARWFRCDLVELAGLDRTIATRTASLRGALAGAGPLTLTCADVTLSETRTEVLEVTFTSCERPHDVELTGAYTMPDGDYPERQRLADLTTDGCRSVGAAYIGVRPDGLPTTGDNVLAFASLITEEMWSVGERSSWCFYGDDTQTRTGSIKNLGTYPY